MRKTLLATKLNIPPPRQALVQRPALLAALSKAPAHALTLVLAPPGYGKTTLVSKWLSEAGIPFAWLSLDESDNDPIGFLEYFLAALHQVIPAVRPDWIDLLSEAQAASFQTLTALVVNEAAAGGDFVLVLDDFHAIHAAPILAMMADLLERLPPSAHLVLLSRTDPPLSIARLRARGQLVEIRAEQLRFSTIEIAEFFQSVIGMPLPTPDVAAMEARTEGWIAGLHLAGLAMQLAENRHAFIANFTGSHAYIMDYLTEEVLRCQTDEMRDFLLQTAVLGRMCAPLCEAVVQPGSKAALTGQAMLETLERNMLFITPLDMERRWFRYHHLFQEVLSRRLEVAYPERIPDLHCRASEWFERQGLIHDSVHHALSAGDSSRAARLVEQHGCELLMAGELMTLSDWLAALEPYTRDRPWLAMQKAWVLSLRGQLDFAVTAINSGEQLLATLEPSDEVRTLRGSMAAARAQCANAQGKTHLAARYARQAIDLLSVSGDFSCALRSVATLMLGDASWAQGNIGEARQAYAEAVQIGRVSGNPHMTMLAQTSLADVHLEEGQLHQAARLYADTLCMAEQADGPNSSYGQGAHFGLSRVNYAWNRLDTAAASGETCLRLCRQWQNISLQAACLAHIAQIEHAGGELEKAQAAAAAAEELLLRHTLAPHWAVRVKTALARARLNQGEIEKALVLVQDAGIGPDGIPLDHASQLAFPTADQIPYPLEPAIIVLAHIFLEHGRPDAVLLLCERLLPTALAGQRGKSVLELLILQALAHHTNRDLPAALESLSRAITLARPEQAAREFLDQSERMARLLYQAKARCIGGEFLEGLLSHFNQAAPAEPPPGAAVCTSLVEPLSPRELEVLRAIAEGCSNQEIAARYVLSPKTVKRHVSNIYAKLAAKNRTQAVALARSLSLIE